MDEPEVALVAKRVKIEEKRGGSTCGVEGNSTEDTYRLWKWNGATTLSHLILSKFDLCMNCTRIGLKMIIER